VYSTPNGSAGLNVRLSRRIVVDPPGTSKCQPSSADGTMPAQLPVTEKPAAVIGGGVLGSRLI
jgi:hypothetical protein